MAVMERPYKSCFSVQYCVVLIKTFKYIVKSKIGTREEDAGTNLQPRLTTVLHSPQTEESKDETNETDQTIVSSSTPHVR